MLSTWLPLTRGSTLVSNTVTNAVATLHGFYARVCVLDRKPRHDSPVSGKEDGEILGLFSKNLVHCPMIAVVRSFMCHESLLPTMTKVLKLGTGAGDTLESKLDCGHGGVEPLTPAIMLDLASKMGPRACFEEH